MKPWLALAALAAVVVACGGSGDAVASPVAPGGIWRVARVGEVAAVPAREPVVEFLGDTIRVVTTCADLRGPLALDGTGIRIGELAPTGDLEPCGGDARVFDGLLLDALSSAHSMTVGRGRTTISGGSEVLLVTSDLVPSEVEAALLGRLTHGAWRLVDGGRLRAHPELPPVAFGDETLTAPGPCGFGGRWLYRGEDLLHLVELSWDSVGDCPDAAQRSRDALGTVLEGMQRFRFDADGSTLTLVGTAGEVTFEADVAAS